MCNFGSQAEKREGRRVVSYYIDSDTTQDQCRLLNPTPLYCIAGYIMEDAVGDRALMRLPQITLNFIDGSISGYFYIINSPKLLKQIRQAEKLASVLCDLESARMGEKEEDNKRAT